MADSAAITALAKKIPAEVMATKPVLREMLDGIQGDTTMAAKEAKRVLVSMGALASAVEDFWMTQTSVGASGST